MTLSPFFASRILFFTKDDGAFQYNKDSSGVRVLRISDDSFFQGIRDVPPFLLDEQLIFSSEPSDGLKD